MTEAGTLLCKKFNSNVPKHFRIPKPQQSNAHCTHIHTQPTNPSVHQTRIVYNKRYKTQIHTLQSMALHFSNKINSKWSNERGQQTNTKSQMALTTSCSHITGGKNALSRHYYSMVLVYRSHVAVVVILFYFILYFKFLFFHSQLIRAHQIGAQKRFLVE